MKNISILWDLKDFSIVCRNYPIGRGGSEMKNYTEEEIRAIKKLQKTTKDPVMHRKYLVISLHMKGYTNRHIAEIVDLEEHRVGIYIRIYDEYGAGGLVPKKSPGAPKRLTDEQERKLYETIRDKTPDEVGFDGRMNWSAKIACLWVNQEFGVQYKVNGMLDIFHRLNLSFTRPTYVLAKADPVKQAQFREDFDAVKKTSGRCD